MNTQIKIGLFVITLMNTISITPAANPWEPGVRGAVNKIKPLNVMATKKAALMLDSEIKSSLQALVNQYPYMTQAEKKQHLLDLFYKSLDQINQPNQIALVNQTSFLKKMNTVPKDLQEKIVEEFQMLYTGI